MALVKRRFCFPTDSVGTKTKYDYDKLHRVTQSWLGQAVTSFAVSDGVASVTLAGHGLMDGRPLSFTGSDDDGDLPSAQVVDRDHFEYSVGIDGAGGSDLEAFRNDPRVDQDEEFQDAQSAAWIAEANRQRSSAEKGRS